MEGYSHLLCHEELLTPSPQRPLSFLLQNRGDSCRLLLQHCSKEERPVAVGSNGDTHVDEDCSHLFQSYVQREDKFAAPDDYLRRLRASINLHNARFRGAKSILLGGFRLNLQHKTVFAAVNHLDRFISMTTHDAQQWKTWMVELISIACLSIAAKFEEVCHPNFYELQMESPHFSRKFDPRTIKQMEFLVLKALDWQLNSVTCYSYLELLTGYLDPQIIARITDLLIRILLDPKFLEFKQSVVAVSMLRYAVKEAAPMSLDGFFSFLEPLIPEECKAKMKICYKMIEDCNAETLSSSPFSAKDENLFPSSWQM